MPGAASAFAALVALAAASLQAAGRRAKHTEGAFQAEHASLSVEQRGVEWYSDLGEGVCASESGHNLAGKDMTKFVKGAAECEELCSLLDNRCHAYLWSSVKKKKALCIHYMGLGLQLGSMKKGRGHCMVKPAYVIQPYSNLENVSSPWGHESLQSWGVGEDLAAPDSPAQKASSFWPKTDFMWVRPRPRRSPYTDLGVGVCALSDGYDLAGTDVTKFAKRFTECRDLCTDLEDQCHAYLWTQDAGERTCMHYVGWSLQLGVAKIGSGRCMVKPEYVRPVLDAADMVGRPAESVHPGLVPLRQEREHEVAGFASGPATEISQDGVGDDMEYGTQEAIPETQVADTSQESPEQRVAYNGASYTRQEFLDYYGDVKGQRKWEAAADKAQELPERRDANDGNSYAREAFQETAAEQGPIEVSPALGNAELEPTEMESTSTWRLSPVTVVATCLFLAGLCVAAWQMAKYMQSVKDRKAAAARAAASSASRRAGNAWRTGLGWGWRSS